LLELHGSQWYYRSKYVDGAAEKAMSYLIVENDEDDGLGKPLPKGIMRLYKADSKGTAQFIGEDNIDHTARGETIRLKLGESFDVSAKRKQLAFSASARVVDGVKFTDYRSSFELVIKNGKSSPAQVRIVEPLYGNWSITGESIPHAKEDAFTAVWLVNVPAEGETILTYSVLTQASR
jgi:hypothetical protein